MGEQLKKQPHNCPVTLGAEKEELWQSLNVCPVLGCLKAQKRLPCSKEKSLSGGHEVQVTQEGASWLGKMLPTKAGVRAINLSIPCPATGVLSHE